MKYTSIKRAEFISRPNRFIAHVNIEGKEEIVHVKNTGRCKELLIPGCEVYLDEPGTPGRKTRYDLVAVRKSNGLLINMDSQAPNKVVKEWLESQKLERIAPEYTYGDSRLDFYVEKKNPDTGETEKILMEVKGCTLEVDGMGYFPDAPTTRGVKHLNELAGAVKEGYRAILAFAIQMDGINEVKPNIDTHPEFADAFHAAVKAGVEVYFLTCHVEPDSLSIVSDLLL